MNEVIEDLNAETARSSLSTQPKLKGLFEYLLIIRDRWLLAVALSLPVSLGYIFCQYKTPESYQTYATFRIEPPLTIINTMQPVERDKYSVREVGRHLEGLRSGELKARVIKAIKEDDTKRAILLAPYVKDDGSPPKVAQAVNYSVSLVGEGIPILRITAIARNGEGAAMIANLAQDEYERIHDVRKGKKHDMAITFLEEQMNKSRKLGQAIDANTRDFKRQHNLAFIEDEKKDVADRKSQYQGAITLAQVEKLRIQSTLRQIIAIQGRVEQSTRTTKDNEHARTNDEMEKIKEYFEISAVETYGNVQALRQKLLDLETTRKAFEVKYLEKHPKMSANTRAVQELHRLLRLEVKTAIKDLTNRVSEMASQESEFTKAMDAVQRESQKLDDIETRINEMTREKEIHEKTHDIMLNRLNEVKVTRALPQEDDPLKRDSPAVTPTSPFEPDKSSIHRTGALIFLACFILIPMAFEFIDNRVKSPWDIEVFLGRDLIAGIPKISTIKEAERPLIVGNELDDGLMESFRSMFSRIQMNSTADGPKSILITSAIPSEGKSLLAANLAYSCANHGRRTILLDFDLRRPGLHKFCGVSNDKGLLTLINEIHGEHGTEPERNALTEIYPNLYVLPSGGKTRAATEMLARPDFDILLSNLKKLCDILIIDSPPVGLFPDSMAMARKVDEVLCVIRYGKVSRKVVKNLLAKVDETGANVLGVVLNDLPEKKTPGYYYAGYYGYGYFRYKYYNKYYGENEPQEHGKAKAG